jgi:hypothetical protein
MSNYDEYYWNAKEEIKNLKAKLHIAKEGLKILRVAVNDHGDDPGATSFINKLLFEITEE